MALRLIQQDSAVQLAFNDATLKMHYVAIEGDGTVNDLGAISQDADDFINPPVQTPLAVLTMTGVLANDKTELPANCCSVLFKLTGNAAYVNPASAEPTTTTGIQFLPNIVYSMGVRGATHLYGEAAGGTLEILAYSSA